jgi:glyoxylase I family protein
LPYIEGDAMAGQIEMGSIHHLRLTVTDIERSREFYTELLGFTVAVEAPESEDPKSDPSYPVLWGGCVMSKGNYLLGLRPVAAKGDQFDENRVGLDHLSFSVETRAALNEAIRKLDERGVPRGEVRELTSFGICVVPFRDPDNIQLELTSPL